MEDLFANVEFKKLKGDVNVQTRTVINNVFLFLKELKRDPEKICQLNFKKPRENAAFICGVSRATVDRIKAEISESGSPATPRESFIKPPTVTNMDSVDIKLLKNTITAFRENGEYPSVAKILAKYSELRPDFKCGKTSMKKILRDNGYKFKKNKKLKKEQKDSVEETDIICTTIDENK